MRRLLLDFGGVIIKTPFELLHRVGSRPWTGPFDPGSDPMWVDLQADVISEREYWHRRATEVFPDSDDPSRDLMAIVYGPPADEVVRPEVAGLLDEVDRPAVLTNDLTRFHSGQWLADMGFDRRFDPIIDLSFLGSLKPEPEAYAHALKELGAEPAEVVFVDDQPRNAAGADACGLVGVWFDVTDPAGSVDRVRAVL